MLQVVLPGTTGTSALALSQHVITTNFTVVAGDSVYVSRYLEIASGITVTIGTDADLEIG